MKHVKNKIYKHMTLDEVSGRSKHVSKIPVSANESKIKKEIVKESIQEPARFYFSSPCLLSELEDNEYVNP